MQTKITVAQRERLREDGLEITGQEGNYHIREIATGKSCDDRSHFATEVAAFSQAVYYLACREYASIWS